MTTPPDDLSDDAFGHLLATVVADYDVIDFLNTITEYCTTLLDVTAAGMLVVDDRGVLNPIAVSVEHNGLLELLYLQSDDGPSADCVSTGSPVICGDLTTAAQRWPQFAPAAVEAGYRAAHALPMRLRGEVIGTLTIVSKHAGMPEPRTVTLAQTLTDIGTIGLTHDRVARSADLVLEQLQETLNHRIRVEQAKGVLAERLDTTVDKAFQVLRTYARHNGLHLAETARGIVEGSADLSTIAEFRPTSRE